MAVYEITFSPTGGTDKVTELLTEAMDGEKRRISLLPEKEDYSRHVFKSGDICFIAVPSFGGRVPQEAAKRLGMMKGNQARAVLVCVYGNRAYEDTLIELKDVADKAGFVPAAAVATIAEHSIMHKFAAGRPDETDQKELREFGKRVREYLEHQEKQESSVFREIILTKSWGRFLLFRSREKHAIPADGARRSVRWALLT